LQTIVNAQNDDTLNNNKWINYNRNNENPNYKANKNWERKYLTNTNDTIERIFNYSHFRDTGPILYEFSKINGEINGLVIGYHPNGKIYSVQYYLDNRPWETISLSDSSGINYHPGDLTNGNGTIPFLSNDGQDLGYVTYKNGYPDGAFFHKLINNNTAIKGELKYKPECVNYIPAIKVSYIENSDTLQSVIEKKEYQLLVQNGFFDSTKIISLYPDSTKEAAPLNEVVGVSFPDTEVVPVGKWIYYNYKSNEVHVEYQYDDCGNEIKRTTYNSSGKVTDKTINQPAKKRKRKEID
jgi:antitoxin component YwqK of YwqJK toxin-antitoxin module